MGLPAPRIEAAGHVDAQHLVAGQRPDGAGVGLPRRRRQTGAEQRVEDEVGAVDGRCQGLRLGRKRGIDTRAQCGVQLVRRQIAKLAFAGDDHGAYPATPGGQVTRRDQPISTVVATTGNNSDSRWPLIEHVPGAPRHLPAGNLHQLDDVDAGGSRRGVERGDLRGVERAVLALRGVAHPSTSTRTTWPRRGPPRLAAGRPSAATSR
jgi:hypothetical protein